jgi:2-oxoisovalerate dehydrogenase E1 component
MDMSTSLGRYQLMLRSRLIEEHMLMALRKGQISKWFSGIGQEGISVGAASALSKHEYLLTVHRNLGAFVTREIPLRRLFCQFLGKPEGFTKGRDRTFHFGSTEYHIVGMISHLAAQLCVGTGIALAQRLKNSGGVALAFTGEGATSEGDFHEALNLASTWKLPIIFVVENNGYALSTPTEQQYTCQKLSDRALGYGIEGLTIDGNNVEEVYSTIAGYVEKIRRQPQPVIVECLTFRMRGHEEASGTDYVPDELFEYWGTKDPVSQAFVHLIESSNCWDGEKNQRFIDQQKEEIAEAFDYALSAGGVQVSVETELSDVYCPDAEFPPPSSSGRRIERRFVDALNDALRLAMRQWPDLILMGQDIATYGGVFKVTDLLLQEFGAARVRDTPLCESAVLGAALGLAIEGYRSVVEMQFADFVSCGFNQIVNNLAKTHYRWGQSVPVTVRLPTGAGVGAGPFHSQSNEAWFMHVPGLKVVVPSNPEDAKGLLLASIADHNPVLFFEHKSLYRTRKAEIPDDFYVIPLGRASVCRAGEVMTVITYGLGVHWVQAILSEDPALDVELIDLRTLVPLDIDTIVSSVKKTGKALVVCEPPDFCGPGAEIVATLSEHCFEYLDAPIRRLGSLYTPIPFERSLEQQYLPLGRLKAAMLSLYNY